MKEWIDGLLNLLFPNCCLVCNGPVSREENYICLDCLAGLPRTNFHLQRNNSTEQIFWGQIPIERGTSFVYYHKGSDFNKIVYSLKYGKSKEIGDIMGKIIASEIKNSGFFESIDLIIPIPLHKRKEKERGYNQSEWIAKGISEISGIPVRNDLLIRKIHNPTQTKKTPFERWENVKNIFELSTQENLDEKHILLVDDVLTTGSTLLSASQIICQAYKTKISILTLAITSTQ